MSGRRVWQRTHTPTTYEYDLVYRGSNTPLDASRGYCVVAHGCQPPFYRLASVIPSDPTGFSARFTGAIGGHWRAAECPSAGSGLSQAAPVRAQPTALPLRTEVVGTTRAHAGDSGRGGLEINILSLCRLALETAGARRCCLSAAPAAGAQAGGWHGDLQDVDACDADFAYSESPRRPCAQDQRSRALFHGRYLEFRIALPCPHRCARQAKADGCGGAIRAARASAGRR